MKPFSYVRATTIEEAIAARAAPRAHILAGGTDLIAQMKAGQRTPEYVVDVKRVSELNAVTWADPGSPAAGDLVIGAAVSASRLAGDAAIAARHPGLHDALGIIGSLQIQNRASLGGNICNAAPSADAVPPLIADGAEAEIVGPSAARRRVPLSEIFAGPGCTTLRDDELLAAVILPNPVARSGSAYVRFTPRREMDIAVVGAAARLTLAADGTIAAARVALASVAPTPVRAPSAEAVLTGAAPVADLFAQAGAAAQSDACPISDTRASADYRRELIAVLVRRALERANQRIR
jgi:carbon-monoxide dehydrogenase medium subunit